MNTDLIKSFTEDFVQNLFNNSIHQKMAVNNGRPTLPPGLEITQEMSTPSPLIEGERQPIHHLMLHLSLLMGLTISHIQSPSKSRRTELLHNVLHVLYDNASKNDGRYLFPKRLDAYLFYSKEACHLNQTRRALGAALLSTDCVTNTFLSHRLLDEYLLLMRTGHMDPRCIDHLTYHAELHLKKALEEDGTIQRRSVILGLALGVAMAKSQYPQGRETLEKILLPQLADARVMLVPPRMHDEGEMTGLSTHAAGSSATFTGVRTLQD
eukprot:Blabericola_migrator_1__11743@NODE_70_length_15323_cov_105_367593_g63_i0_p7_GENE_NODE_70_length_15323_cov_105_367593_g63_i0NODE_70_length_15323_cov_105_367593_g63_i0_p7_ORF_typecomplete_len267_score27_54Nup35_RRM/PF05172_13/2_9e03Nup35_RRM/PF05172_13/0_077_NODE_70_length_15323_cov_105_367593_g63_i047615561